jgi:hypothetical protein
VVDETGSQRVRVRIEDTAAGFARLMRLLAEQNAISEQPITIAIETAKGLLPAALRAAGVPLIAINPLAVSRYPDRHSPSRAKSDAGDASVLANILRTDPRAHRPTAIMAQIAVRIAAEGRKFGHPAPAWVPAPNATAPRRLRPIEPAASLMRRVFDLIIAGQTLYAICAVLNNAARC